MGTLIGDMTVGEPPHPLNAGFPPWCRGYRDEIMDEIDSVPRTDFYFALSGDDDTGDGSPENPWLTVGRMQEVLTGGTYRRCLLNRGDHWETGKQLNLDTEGAAVGSYGSGELPKFQQEGVELDENTVWTQSGAAYYTDISAMTGTFARIVHDNNYYEDGDVTGLFPFKLVASIAACQAEPDTAHFDSGNDLIYINVGGDPNGTAFRCFKIQGAGLLLDNGILSTADMTWVDSIRTRGFGLSGTYGADGNYYHLKHSPSVASHLCVMSNCKGDQYRKHLLGINGSGGGIMHVENVVGGWSEHTEAGAVSYFCSTSALVQGSAFTAHSTGGKIPNTTSNVPAGKFIEGHGNGSDIAFSLGLAYKTTVANHKYMNASTTIWIQDAFPGSPSSMTDRRDFAVYEVMNNSEAEPDNISLKNIMVNCYYELVSSDIVAVMPIRNSGLQGWFYINCYIDIQSTFSPGTQTFGLFNQGGDELQVCHIYGCYVILREIDTGFGDYRINRKAYDTVNGDYHAYATIFQCEWSKKQAQLGLGNNEVGGTRLNECALYNFQATTNPTHLGHDNMPNYVTLGSVIPDEFPDPLSPVYQAAGSYTVGTEGDLEYDAAEQLRSPTDCSMGRFEPRRVTGGRGAMTVMITPDMKRRIEQGNPSIGRG